ncbi:MAG: hypothetical protein ABEI06_07805 [Halobacteriaceae archaeon]
MSVGEETIELSREEVVEIKHTLEDAVTERDEFVHTIGTYHPDGAYTIKRRGATSAGNKKKFESFVRVRQIYDALPRKFDAEDIGKYGITGSRRHMVIWHYIEHPRFACQIQCRNPLTASKSYENQ